MTTRKKKVVLTRFEELQKMRSNAVRTGNFFLITSEIIANDHKIRRGSIETGYLIAGLPRHDDDNSDAKHIGRVFKEHGIGMHKRPVQVVLSALKVAKGYSNRWPFRENSDKTVFEHLSVGRWTRVESLYNSLITDESIQAGVDCPHKPLADAKTVQIVTLDALETAWGLFYSCFDLVCVVRHKATVATIKGIVPDSEIDKGRKLAQRADEDSDELTEALQLVSTVFPEAFDASGEIITPKAMDFDSFVLGFEAMPTENQKAFVEYFNARRENRRNNTATVIVS